MIKARAVKKPRYALHQHGDPGHPVGIDFAHECRQTAVQAGDEEQASKRVVIDGGIEDEKADKDDVDEDPQERSRRAKALLYGFGDGRRTALICQWHGVHDTKGSDEIARMTTADPQNR